MTLRDALADIMAIPGGMGNGPSSDRANKDFETRVANILRNVGPVIERPNGANSPPPIALNGIHFYTKTAKGCRPQWNETIPDGVLIFNLNFGTIITHSDLVLSPQDKSEMTAIKKHMPKYARSKFGHKTFGVFKVAGARIQFKDTVDWKKARMTMFHDTLGILGA